MQRSHNWCYLGISLAVGSLLMFSSTAQAQTNNASDVTGAIITTSDITNGAFIPSSTYRREFIFASNKIEDAVNLTASALNQQLASRTFAVASGSSLSIPSAFRLQQVLESVLTETGNVDANASLLQNALLGKDSKPDLALVEKLIKSLRGLTAGGKVSPAKFADAVNAYNAIVKTSSNEFLNNSPEEFGAIRSVLSAISNAAYAAKNQ